MDVFTAAYRGDLQRVRAVVEQDAGLVNATDNHNETPLAYAALGGHVEVVRYLLDHGALVNARRDDIGGTALHCACLKNDTQVVLLLLQRGADATADNEGSTVLMYAATIGRDAVVRALLEHGGSDVDAAEHGNERTACHWACFNGHARVRSQLLEAGADPMLRDADGRVAGDLAADNGHEGCVAI